MSKISLDRVTSSFGFQSAFNSILDKIEKEFSEKVLYRDNPIGEVNNMNNDLDMSGNDVLNVGTISADDFRVNGQDLGETVNSLVDKIDDALDEVNTSVIEAEGFADEAEGWANEAKIAATTVAYNKHEGTLLSGESVIALPWPYDVAVGVEVFLSGVKQASSTLTFTNSTTVALVDPVEEDTPYEVVSTSRASSQLGTQLADPNGSALVGFLQDGPGASARTVQEKMRDVVSVKDFGAVGDGVTDDTAAIQKAIDSVSSSGGVVIIPHGAYVLSGTINMRSNVEVLCEAGASFDATSFTDPAVFFGGSIGPEYPFTANAETGDVAFSVSGAPGFAVGDIIHFVSVTNALSRVDAGTHWLGSGTSDGSGGDTNAYFAEWNVIAQDMGSGQYRIAKPFIFPGYKTNNYGMVDTSRTTSAAQKVSPIQNSAWAGGTIIRTNPAGDVFDSLWALKCEIRDCNIQRGQQLGHAIQWKSSCQCEAKNVTCVNDAAVTWDYDTLHGKMNRFLVVGSQDCGFDGIKDSFSAQSVDFSYASNGYCNVRPYCVGGFFDNCFEGLTSHAGSYQERWVGNTINLPCSGANQSGISVRGYEPTVSGNFISAPTSVTNDGSAFVSYGIALSYGGPRRAFVTNNVVRGFYAAFAVNGSTTLDWKLENAVIDISNNEISDCLYGLYTVTEFGSINSSIRYINYRLNRHSRLGQFMAYLDEYSAGCSIVSNSVDGAFTYTGIKSDVGLVFSRRNTPMLNVIGNIWTRPKGSNPGLNKYAAFIGSVEDTAVYPEADWAGQSVIEDNFATFSTVDNAGIVVVGDVNYNQLAFGRQNPYRLISNGSVSIVPAKTRVTAIRVDTEGAAATDNLDAIVPATNLGFQVGDTINIKTFVSSRDVVIRDSSVSGVATNGFRTPLAEDVTISTSVDYVTCVYTGTLWCVTSRAV